MVRCTGRRDITEIVLILALTVSLPQAKLVKIKIRLHRMCSLIFDLYHPLFSQVLNTEIFLHLFGLCTSQRGFIWYRDSLSISDQSTITHFLYRMLTGPSSIPGPYSRRFLICYASGTGVSRHKI